jgi:protease II
MMQIPFLKKNQLLTCSLTKLMLSDNQECLAFVVDPNNDENLVAGFRDLKTGKFLVRI